MSPDIANIFEQSGVCLDSMCFHRAKRMLEVKLSSPRLVPDKMLDKIKSQLEEKLPKGASLKLTLSFDCSDIDFRENFDEAQRAVKGRLMSDFPECAPVIRASQWLLSDSEEAIAVRVPERYMTVMKRPIAFARSNYNIGMPIELTDTDTDEKDTNEEATHAPCFDFPEPLEVKAKAKADSADTAEKKPETIVIFGKSIPKNTRITPIESIRDATTKPITIRGHLIPLAEDEKKNQKDDSVKRVVGSKTAGITIQRYFARRNASDEDKKKAAITVKDINNAFDANKGMDLLIRGTVRLDNNNDPILSFTDICAIERERRQDKAEGEKRVELHLHTTMSEMDGITGVADAISTAAAWGHKAIAITDHGVVHSFPDAMRAAKKAGIKLLYGVEGYLLDDCELLETERVKDMKLLSVAVVASFTMGELNLREIAAKKHDTGEEFHTYVNTGMPTLSSFAYKYSREDLANAPGTEDALKQFCDFAEGYAVCTYTPEEYEGMCHKAASYGISCDPRYIDLKALIHYIYIKHTPLINTEHIDNALNVLKGRETPLDLPPVYAKETAQKTRQVFDSLYEKFKEDGSTFPYMYGSKNNKESKHISYYHIILLAKDRRGLKNMYKMITYSHTECFNRRPLMPRSLFSVRRHGIILGSACERGELFRAMVAGADDDKLRKMAAWYDYIEVQPIGNNEFMVRQGTARDDDELRAFNKHLLDIADSVNKPCVATGDVHFLEPEDSVYRAIIMNALNFKDAEQQAPLYFKTTDEMLDEFSYLGEDRAREIVIENPNAIAEMCDGSITAYLNDEKTYTPVFDGANDELTSMSMKRAHEIYGDSLPDIVQKRLDFELNSIIGNGYATLYLMAQRLVFKSNSDGYLVGSRGSVGSSLVAFLAGITEVNPLAPHYVCPNCRHSDFESGKSFWCGADMPDKLCPECGEKYVKYGFDIPFETFLGFKGDKTPDIDLNFSGSYQPKAHAYTKVMFGDDHSFRAGTISTLKEKTAFEYVYKYFAERGEELTHATIHTLAMGCAGVKRTTGQHAGGMVIVPEEYEAEDFMPLQYPANKKESGFITHFDFHAMDEKLVKLDILGHVDPTALRMMQDMTGLNPRDIPLSDPETKALFSTSEPLGVDLSAIGCDLGTIGIPEYGTQFARGILKKTRPTTIEELVRLAGLSHGTNVWQGNAENLVDSGKAGLGDVIGTRDDIMVFLIKKGSDPLLAFKTMESVRKGKGLTPEMEENMKKLDLPDWYIPSCKLIKYMFPRAHAAAYLTMAFRVAYYKMHYPSEFYAVYYTTRADDFDIVTCMGTAEEVLATKKRIDFDVKAAGRSTTTAKGESVAKLNGLSAILEVVYEMNLRGIKFLPIDINESEATRFKVKDGNLLPPFNAIGGLGAGIAEKIVEMRNKLGRNFTSIDDFASKTGAGSTVISKLEALGCFDGIAQSNQTSFF